MNNHRSGRFFFTPAMGSVKNPNPESRSDEEGIEEIFLVEEQRPQDSDEENQEPQESSDEKLSGWNSDDESANEEEDKNSGEELSCWDSGDEAANEEWSCDLVEEFVNEEEEESVDVENSCDLVEEFIEEEENTTESLMNSLAAVNGQQQEAAEDVGVNCAVVMALKDHIAVQQEESLEKDNKIMSLCLIIENLQNVMENRDEMVSCLQNKVNLLTTDLEASFSQQHKEAERLSHLTQENQKLVSENETLAAVNGQQQEAAEDVAVNCAVVMALKEHIAVQQKESREKDNKIMSIGLIIENLQNVMENRDEMVSCLQNKVNLLTTDLEASFSQQHKEAERLSHLTQENQKLVSENETLAAVNRQQQEAAEDVAVNCAVVMALKEHIAVQQEESLEKDNKIMSIGLIIENLQNVMENRDEMVSCLQNKVNLLTTDLEASFSQQHKEAERLSHLTQENQKLVSENETLAAVNRQQQEAAEDVAVNCAVVMALKEHIAVQQKESREKDNKIMSIGLIIENLQNVMENRDEMVSCLQNKVNLLTTDLEASFSQQHKEAERLSHLTQENQKLVSENERLQSELQSALLALKELQEEETGGSRPEEEYLRAKVADLMKSQKELQLSKEKLKGTIYDMTAELEGKNTIIKKLENNLEACHIQQERSEELDQLNCAEQQQEDSLQKDKEIGSLHFNIQNLLTAVEDRDKTVSALQITVKQLASDLKEEQAKNSSLQRDLHIAVEELESLTPENQKQASEITRLKGELKAAKLAGEQLQGSSRDEEALKDHIAVQQEESLEKDNKIMSLCLIIENLQNAMENRDEMVSCLQNKVNLLTTDLEASFSQQHKEAERLSHLTQENQKLVSENERLQSELQSALLALKELQEEETGGSRPEEEYLRAQVADLMKSQKELQLSKEKLKGTIYDMTAELEGKNTIIKKLENNLEACHIQQERSEELDQLNCAEQQQEDSLQKDKEIGSLHFNIQTLLTEVEDRDKTVSALQITVKQLASDLKEEQAKNSSLQRDLHIAVEELESLTPENQKQASEITRLKGELKAAKLAEEQLQKEGSSRDEENKEQKALLIKTCKTLKCVKKKLFEKSQALENSLAAEKLFKSALDDEKMCSKRIFSQQQAAPNAPESSKCLMDEVKTLRKENADIRAQLETTFREHQQTKAKYQLLYEHQEQMLSSKTDMISENNFTTMNLQIMVEDLKAAQLESRTRQTSLEGALRETREKMCELQKAADEAAAQLETERTKCFKQGIELQEAWIKNNVCLKERQKLLEDLQRTQDTGFMQTKQQMQMDDEMKRRDEDVDLRLSRQQVELDQSRTAFRKLHDQHAELGKENSNLKGSYRKLRYAYKDLKLQYNTLCIASDYSQS
ncbi:putative leucine-rich repeat-containing protein DDB_G0290503 [Labrus bergylta]|uniref:putative leucine-rich repeat-containing protein DDB_G0290503 n=1 Tax=Labrus bergylta TaxID=56723 RepID=UPI003313FCD2